MQYGAFMKLRQITIDGTAGAGKSTLGELLAQLLGYLYIDTGAMYRALAWLALSKSVDIHNAHSLPHLARTTEIVISHPHIHDGRQYTVMIHSEDVTWAIRSTVVTQAVPIVSKHPSVRKILIEQQRTMAQHGGVIMVGRDIGTVVLPNADLKIYLDASPEVRAYRRYFELKNQKNDSNIFIDREKVLQDVLHRDMLDQANMQPARDAIIINTDHISKDQLAAKVYQMIDELSMQPAKAIYAPSQSSIP